LRGGKEEKHAWEKKEKRDLNLKTLLSFLAFNQNFIENYKLH